MTCMYCDHRDTSVVYTSNPPKYQCKITGKYVTADHECDVEFAPVRHGRWIYDGKRGRFPACKCSVCGAYENADWAVIQGDAQWCPHCGAKMDLGDEDATD